MGNSQFAVWEKVEGGEIVSFYCFANVYVSLAYPLALYNTCAYV